MKKITLLITMCLLTSLGAIAQSSIYYEDFRYENEGRGFTIQIVSNVGQVAGDIGKRVGDVVDESDSGGLFDASSRPATRIPDGGARDQRTVSFKNVTSDPDANHAIEAWALMTSQDLSSINGPAVTFWTEQRYAIGGNSSLKILVSSDYVHGNLPATASWTDETANITGKIATSGVDPQTYVKGTLDLSSYTGTSVTVAFKNTSDDSVFSDTNKNGTFYIGDVSFTNTQVDVADGAFSALNTSFSGQENIFNTPSASISTDNFSNTSKWAEVLTSETGVPRLKDGVEIPANEGYLFEVSSAYNPIVVTKVRHKLTNSTENKGSTGDSQWIVQASNDASSWDTVSEIITIPDNTNTEIETSLTTMEPYRYYRFVLNVAWTPDSGQLYTALQQLDFTVDSTVLSVDNNILDENITVYPNPTSSIINIQNTGDLTITSTVLVDLTGKVLKNSSNGNSIDVSNLAKGIYLVKVTTTNGAIISKKIIVN